MIKKLILPFEPMGAVRMNRSDAWRKRPCVERYFDYRDKIVLEMNKQNVSVDELADLWRVDWHAEIPFKKSYSKKKCKELLGRLHQEKPDKDNIEKGLLDSLFKNSEHDDKLVGCGWSEKVWCEKGSTGSVTLILHLGEPVYPLEIFCHDEESN